MTCISFQTFHNNSSQYASPPVSHCAIFLLKMYLLNSRWTEIDFSFVQSLAVAVLSFPLFFFPSRAALVDSFRPSPSMLTLNLPL